MLRTYLTVALRNLRRQKAFSIINITGLATGMAAFILIAMFVENEWSFDRYQEHGDDVYRVVLDAKVGEQEFLTSDSPAVMAGAFIESFPEVMDATRIDGFSADVLITVEDRPFYESAFFLADSSVFNIFTLPLVQGDPQTALNKPNTIVLAESIARKYFGDANAIGRRLQFDNRVDYEVTGVMADPPANTHFRPMLIGSFLTSFDWNSVNWLNNSYYTYIQLRPGSDPDVLAAKFPDFMRTNVGPQIQQFMGQSFDEAIAGGLRYNWVLERMSSIYLHSRAMGQVGRTGDIRYVYILGLIAIFVLLMACINFMNLSTARAAGRAREVGVRKVLGSDRGGLIRQFLGESVLLSLFAMVVSFGIVMLALPVFSSLADAELTIRPWLGAVALGTAVVTGIVAGLYPAFVLSSYQPAVVLKGSFSSGQRGSRLRSVLVVSQFAITVALLVGTSVVFKQLRFIQNTDRGFDVEQVVVVPIETGQANRSFETFRAELMADASVVNVAASGILPGPDHIHNNTAFRAEGMRDDEFKLAGLGEVSDDYVETLGLKMAVGRDFDPAFPSDSTAWVINEAAAREFGWTAEEAIGKRIHRPDPEPGAARVATVVGVMADAHFSSMHEAIRPIIFGNWEVNRWYATIRLRGDERAALSRIEQKWEAFEPGYPFRYFFLDADYQKFYEREQRLGSLYFNFTILAIIIACLGLFGLASFVTAQRTREIGVRKAIGASVGGIVILLSREFTLLVVISCAVAFPVAWFAMSRWLEGFAYRTTIGWEVFALCGALALVIAWATVGWQSVRAALIDPVRALHHE